MGALGISMIAGYLWFSAKDTIIMPEKPKWNKKPMPKKLKKIDWEGKIRKDLKKIEDDRSTLKDRHDYLKFVNKKYSKKGK